MNNPKIYQSEEESLFQIESNQKQLSFNGKKTKTTNFKLKLWTENQNKKYCKFLQKQKHVFQNAQLRKKRKIFVKMSNFLKTRSQIQCKTHHQKMMHFHASIEGIIKYLTLNEQDIQHQPKQAQIQNLSRPLVQITDTQTPVTKNNEDKLQCQQQPYRSQFNEESLWLVLDNQIWGLQQPQQC